MTGQELFNLTVGNMGISLNNAISYEATAIPQINTILAQTFDLENNNREFKGMAVLTEIPTITSLTEALTYQPNVLRNVVMWGLASIFALNDDEDLKIGYYSQQYVEGQRNESKAVFVDIIDFYSQEA